MSKRTIRLTESDLHNIIKESVNNILSELDWKTGVEAAKKAEKNGDSSRKQSFLNYATKRLKDKYPNNYDEGIYDGVGVREKINPYLNTNYGYMNYDYSEKELMPLFGGPSFWEDREFHKSFGDKGVKMYGKGRQAGHPHPYSYKLGDKDEPKNSLLDWNDMSDDMEKYYTNKSKYQKGKGWE
jgi:hypothetical protein